MTHTPAQQHAIDSEHPQILCCAGPGSGKTQTTVDRIRRLIKTGTPPARIVALTFTNAAANELQERLCNFEAKREINAEEFVTTADVIPPINGHLGYTGTLHGFAFRMIKSHGGLLGYGPRLTVISPESALGMLEAKADALGCKEPVSRLLELKEVGVDTTKRMILTETVVASFLQDLKDASIVDFDILLTEFARLLKEFPETCGADFSHLFVDEVQDSSPTDWRIYRALHIPNKFLVGDPDQSIYGFRGAAVIEMNAFADRPEVQVIELESNFRSTDQICQAAQRLIEHNINRINKATVSTRGPGRIILPPAAAANEGEEIGIVCRAIQEMIALATDPNEIAVIARTNAIAGAFQKTLAACHVPVRQRKKSDLPSDWPRARALVEFMADPENDTLAYLYLTQASQDTNAMRRHAQSLGQTINQQFHLIPSDLLTSKDAPQYLHRAGMSHEAVMLVAERLQDIQPDATMAELALVLARPEEGIQEEGEGVHCLTIHGAKGREFAAVFLVGMEEETIPGKRKDMNIEESRRMCFVAATRAKDFLSISYAQSRVTPWGHIQPMTPSRFIQEMLP